MKCLFVSLGMELKSMYILICIVDIDFYINIKRIDIIFVFLYIYFL